MAPRKINSVFRSKKFVRENKVSNGQNFLEYSFIYILMTVNYNFYPLNADYLFKVLFFSKNKSWVDNTKVPLMFLYFFVALKIK